MLRALVLSCALAACAGLSVPRLSAHAPRRALPPLATASTDAAAAALESELLALASGASRGVALSDGERARLDSVASELEGLASSRPPSSASPLLPGRWRVLFQGKGGERTSFTDISSWRKYLSGDGPSPVQNLVSDSSSVGRLYQILELENGMTPPKKEENPPKEDVVVSRKEDGGGALTAGGRFLNVVDFSESGPLRGLLAIEAQLEGPAEPNRLTFRFVGGRLLLKTIWRGTLDLPYPVPFKLLGDNAKGWLQTDYISPNLRLSRGNKGSLFVLVPEPEPDAAELTLMLAARGGFDRGGVDQAGGNQGGTNQGGGNQGGGSQEEASEEEGELTPPLGTARPPPKSPVLLCPAQFGTESDYQELVETLRGRGHETTVAPLARFDWFRLLPAAFTAEYWTGELKPQTALPFYFEALDRAADRIAAAHPDQKIQLVAHSIGGWVARAYLGQLDPISRARFGALVTLGSPHREPPEGPLRTFDQTRGLLSYVNANYPAAFHPELRYLSVSSCAVKGKVTPALEPLLAFASYLPLSGDGSAEGDGIIPLETAQLPDAQQKVLDDVYHISFVPFLGTRLVGTPWYGSPEQIEKWADFLE